MDKEKTLRKLKQEIEEVREKFGIEFAEVKHGHWERDEYNGGFFCSECLEWEDRERDFCPKCGADMRRVSNGNEADR